MELTPFEREMMRQNERQILLLDKIKVAVQWIGIILTFGLLFSWFG
jgi:hypothetical protein